jgi:hypothetical protein
MIFLTLSCSKDVTVLFVGNMRATFDIPAGANVIETYYITVKNVPTFFEQTSSLANVSFDQVKVLQSAKGLLRSSFQPETYDFIERISIYVSTEKNPSNKREMYYVDFVPYTTDTELRMQSSTSDLLNILNEETVDLEIRINFREFVTRNIPTTIDFGYAAL